MARQDSELDAIRRILVILNAMPTTSRGRVLDYVVSRCESMGLPPPCNGKLPLIEAADNLFAEVEP